MNKKLTEILKIGTAINEADIIGAGIQSGYYSMENYRRAVVKLDTGLVDDTKTVTLQLYEAKDLVATGAQALGDPIVFVVDNVAGEVVEITKEIKGTELTDGFSCISVKVSSNNATAVYGVANLLMGDSRYVPAL